LRPTVAPRRATRDLFCLRHCEEPQATRQSMAPA
jgi:hypothetical protein